MDANLEQRLARIDALIGEHRQRYLGATWHGLTVEAAFHAASVDRLLDLHNRVRRGPLTATLEEATP